MANEIKVIGHESVAGYEFTGIEGGFEEGKRGMLVRDISEIHGTTVSRINELIKNNGKRFKIGIDIVDLKQSPFAVVLNDSGFTQNQINATKHIWMLSERGYAKLLKILEDDTAWDIYDKFVDGYFDQRAQLNQAKPMTFDEKLALALQSEQDTRQRVGTLEGKVDNIIVNQPVNATDYAAIGEAVSNRVHEWAKVHRVPSKQRGPLFKDLNSQIKQVTGAGNRTRIKSSQYDMVINFIDTWQPSSATIVLVQQTELEV